MKLSRFVRNERGAALVEMALVLPIVILLFLGMIDFGRAIFLYNNLTNAARDGARLGSTQTPTINTTTITSTVETRIATYSGAAVSTGHVTVTPPTSLNSYAVTVQISGYPFSPITPLPMVNGMTLSVSASFRWESAPPL